MTFAAPTITSTADAFARWLGNPDRRARDRWPAVLEPQDLEEMAALTCRFLHPDVSAYTLAQALGALLVHHQGMVVLLADPVAVFVNMKRGTIAVPSLRSVLDLHPGALERWDLARQLAETLAAAYPHLPTDPEVPTDCTPAAVVIASVARKLLAKAKDSGLLSGPAEDLVKLSAPSVALPDDDEPKNWRELAEAAIADLRRYARDEIPDRRLISAKAYEERAQLLADAEPTLVIRLQLDDGEVKKLKEELASTPVMEPGLPVVMDEAPSLRRHVADLVQAVQPLLHPLGTEVRATDPNMEWVRVPKGARQKLVDMIEALALPTPCRARCASNGAGDPPPNGALVEMAGVHA